MNTQIAQEQVETDLTISGEMLFYAGKIAAELAILRSQLQGIKESLDRIESRTSRSKELRP